MAKKPKKQFEEKIEIPAGITASYTNGAFQFKGPKGETSKRIIDAAVSVKVESDNIVLTTKKASRNEKARIGTFVAHIGWLIKGVKEGFTYKLKICSGHFPMNVTVEKGELVIKNFLGEKVPRRVKINKDATVKVEGLEVTVSSVNKESAGQTAGNIEQACRITNRDRRIFQDGIYITEKPKK